MHPTTHPPTLPLSSSLGVLNAKKYKCTPLDSHLLFLPPSHPVCSIPRHTSAPHLILTYSFSLLLTQCALYQDAQVHPTRQSPTLPHSFTPSVLHTKKYKCTPLDSHLLFLPPSAPSVLHTKTQVYPTRHSPNLLSSFSPSMLHTKKYKCTPLDSHLLFLPPSHPACSIPRNTSVPH